MSEHLNRRAWADRNPWFQAFALPTIFVFLWSTGFVASKVGLPYAGPFTFLELRYALTITLLGSVALLMRAPWPRRPAILPIAVSGVLLHGGYLGGVFAAISLGVETGTVALLVGLQPVLTAALSGPVLGERVRAHQWAGLALGVIGVGLVVRSKLALGLGTPAGMACSLVAMLSITAGTLWQKRFGANMDLRSGTCVQYAAAALVTLPFAWFEGFHAVFAVPLIFALAWLCIALSVISVFAMFVMLKRGATAKVASLFFLVPPTTAVIAWVMFDETLDRVSFVGMAFVVIAVALVTMAEKPAR